MPRHLWKTTGRSFIILAIIFIAGALIVYPQAVSASKKIIFAINLPPSLLGEGAAEIIVQFGKVGKAVQRKTGYPLELKKYKNWSQVTSALNKGKADMAWLPPYFYARHKVNTRNSNVTPLVTYSVKSSTRSRTCILVRKDSGMTSLDDLIASRVALADESAWVLLNKIFADKKNPFPPKEFFSGHDILTRESAAFALHYKKTDAILMEEIYIGYVEKDIKTFRREIRTLACSSPYSNTMIAGGKNLKNTKLKRMKDALLIMHKDSAFKDFRRFFTPSKGRWVDSKSSYYKEWIDLYEEARRKGWTREYSKIKSK